MKKLLSLVCVLFTITLSSIGQKNNNYAIHNLIKQGDSVYLLKQYKTAYSLYGKAIDLGDTSYNDLYNYSCVIALTGHKNKAIKWLNKSIDKGFVDVDHIQADSDLMSLHNDKRWVKTVARVQAIATRDFPIRKLFLRSVYKAMVAYNNDGYQAAVDTVHAIENKYGWLSHEYFEEWLTLYGGLMDFSSLAGDNYSAIQYWEKLYPASDVSDKVSGFKVVDAGKYIAEKYGNEPVLMINDDEYRGECRAFVRNILPALYNAGFRYLALEALVFEDNSLNDRKFPVNGDGFYVREPAYAQMMRDAMNMGFTCVRYEDTAKGSNNRVAGEARNLYDFIKSHPDGKVLIYSGHGNVYKNHRENAKDIPAGEQLCKKLGHDIPAIEAGSLVEGNTRDREYSIYKTVADSMKIESPSIILVNDTPYVVPRLRGGYVNASVYLPRTDYHLGYPDWMCAGKYNDKPASKDSNCFFGVDIPDSINTTNCFLQVYVKDEFDEEEANAIPVIQFKMDGHKRKYEINVQPGIYYVLISDAKSDNIYEEIYTLEN